MPVEKIVKANHLNFALKIWGNSNAPVIIALHGWLDNAASFDLLAPLLDDYQIITMDQCGHGKSDHRPLGVPYHFVDYVADVFYVADALGLDDFIVMGHSLGANIAVTMAAAMPDRIKALVLIEGFGPIGNPIDKSAKSLGESIGKFLDNNSKKRRYAEFSALVKAREKGMWPLSEEAAILLCERGSIEREGMYSWSSDSRVNFTSPSIMSNKQAAFLRSEIQCSTQIIIGDKGVRPDLSDSEQPLSDFKTKQVVRLSGFHHLHMQREHVQKVAGAITHFLSGLS